MSTSFITTEDALIILNKALKLEPTFADGMEFEEIKVVQGKPLEFRAKNFLDPVFAATYKKVVRDWFPNHNL